jgi:hypothetical protein
MFRQLKAQLRMLGAGASNPSEEWLKANRELLVSQIKNTIVVSKNPPTFFNKIERFLPYAFIYRTLRPLGVVVLIGAIGTSSWIATSRASQDALPGDFLYGAKLAVEKTQVVVASAFNDPQKEAQLHVEFANRRATEVQKVVNDPQKKSLTKEAVASLHDELKIANQKLNDIKNQSSPQVSAVVAKDIQKQTTEIKNTLQDVKTALQVSSDIDDKNLSKQVLVVKDLAKDMDIATVEALVATQLKGTTSISKEELNALIDKTLQDSIVELGSSRQGVGDVKLLLDSIKTELAKKFAPTIKNEYTNISPSTTKVLVDKISNIASETSQAVVKTNTVSEEVSVKIKELNNTEDSKKLEKMLSTIKEVSDATKKIEKISDDALEKVDTVVPLSQLINKDKSVPGSVMFTVTSSPTSVPLKGGVVVSSSIGTNLASTTLNTVMNPTSSSFTITITTSSISTTSKANSTSKPK